ncbi:MAG: response regulator transcription factor [Nitrospirae bacterium]|nr:response regulator transcription factor [Nitrospirota bacterium]
MDIWSLKRQGFSDRAIARKLGIDRRTVKKYIEAKEFPITASIATFALNAPSCVFRIFFILPFSFRCRQTTIHLIALSSFWGVLYFFLQQALHKKYLLKAERLHSK